MSRLSTIIAAFFVLISTYCHVRAGELNSLGHIGMQFIFVSLSIDIVAISQSMVLTRLDEEWWPGMGIGAHPATRVVDAGDKLSLTCTTSKPDAIKWLYPSRNAPQVSNHL